MLYNILTHSNAKTCHEANAVPVRDRSGGDKKKLKKFYYHRVHYFGFVVFHEVLPNGTQQQIVFGQSLHRSDQNVGESQSVMGNNETTALSGDAI